MSVRILWGDDYTRLAPQPGETLEEGQNGCMPPVKVKALRNAFTSFQLSIGPVKPDQTVKIAASDLKGDKQALISAKQFDLYVSWFVPMNGKWYPEVCVPQQLTGGSTPAFRKQNGAGMDGMTNFWVDLFVPAEAKPGNYSGTVTVSVGNEKTAVPVEVAVAKAVIPPECCLDVSMNNYADSISSGWPGLADDPERFNKPRYQKIEQGVFSAAHDHRAFLHYLPYGHSGYVTPSFVPPLVGEGNNRRVASWTAWDRHFGKYFDGSAFAKTRRGAHPVKRFWLSLNLDWPSDFLKFGLPGYEAEWRAVGRDMVDHFKAKGWTKTSFDMFPNHKQRFRYFPWDAEEARFPQDNDLHRYLAKIWKGTFDRKTTNPVRFDYTLGTTWLFEEDIHSDLVDFIDVFIGGGSDLQYHQKELPRLHKKGCQVWPCLNSGNLTDSMRAAAFPPLMVWMLDGDGYMPRWLSMGGWGENAWMGLNSENGGASFLYCGAPMKSDDTFVSARFKTHRNMLQTVDAFQLAADKPGKANIKKAVNRALGIPASGWVPSRKPDPNDTDRFTEEPPLAGWQRFTADQYRKVHDLAITLASGEKA